MKMSTFATVNTKGQLVIPKSMRQVLGIDSNIPLSIALVGDSIYIRPVKDFITTTDSKDSYVELLKKTQGVWANEDWDKLRQNRSKIELTASKNRKEPW